jgi:hypothetical protein
MFGTDPVWFCLVSGFFGLVIVKFHTCCTLVYLNILIQVIFFVML